MWLAASAARCAPCDDISGDSRTVGWRRWGMAVVTREDFRVWRGRDGDWWSNSKHKDTLSARSRGGSASARMRFGNSSDVWDGKPPRPFKESCHFRRKELRTQNCPVLHLLPLHHHCQPRHKVRTENCPLFVPPPKKVLCGVMTPIRAIAAPTDCWRVWGCWRTRLRCLARPQPFQDAEFSWPCPS